MFKNKGEENMNSDEEKWHPIKFPKSFETIKGDLEKIPNKFYNCALYHGFTKKMEMWEIQWSLYTNEYGFRYFNPPDCVFRFKMFSKQKFIGENLYKLIGTLHKLNYQEIIRFLYENSEKGFSEKEFQDKCGLTYDSDSN